MKNKVIYLIVLGALFSFSSIDAIVFSPGLTMISKYFSITSNTTGYAITSYIIGCTIGQLVYGPLTNYYGSRNTVKIGAILSIIGALGCILSYYTHSFSLLLAFRFITALGAASGIKLTYTIVSKIFNQKENVSAMSLITISFAIVPNIGVFIGGFLVSLFDWTGPFYLIIIYSIMIFVLVNLLPDVCKSQDSQVLKMSNILNGYIAQFKNLHIILGGLLIGLSSSVVYVFTALAPFISMNIMNLTPISYGKYNLILCIGKLLGAISSSYFGRTLDSFKAIKYGFIICFCGVVLISFLPFYFYPIMLFTPMVLVYFGLSFIYNNVIVLTLCDANDKSNASAVMSFISMLFAFCVTQILVFLKYSMYVKLICTYWVLFIFATLWYAAFIKVSSLSKKSNY